MLVSHMPVILVMEMDKEENMEQQDSNSNSVCRNICGVCIEAVENGESKGGTHFSPVWKVKAGHDLRGASSSYSSSFVDSILQIQSQDDISIETTCTSTCA